MKTGNIVGVGAAAALIAAVAPASPTNLTLGALASAIMAELSPDALLLIGMNARTLDVLDIADAAAVAAALVAEAPDDIITLTMVDDTKSSSTWNAVSTVQTNGVFTPLAAAPALQNAVGQVLSASLGYSKPSKSGAALIGSIEVLTLDPVAIAAGYDGAVVLVNQSAKTIKVYVFSAANEAAALVSAIAASTSSATFTQTIVVGSASASGFWSL